MNNKTEVSWDVHVRVQVDVCVCVCRYKYSVHDVCVCMCMCILSVVLTTNKEVRCFKVNSLNCDYEFNMYMYSRKLPTL